MAQTVKNPPAMQETRIWSLGQKDPPVKGMTAHSSILARRFQGQRSRRGVAGGGTVHGVAKRWA